MKLKAKLITIEGGAPSQAVKRAKIIDSDNEGDMPGEEGGENQGNEGQRDGGESSDGGVNDDMDRVCVFHLEISRFLEKFVNITVHFML